MKDCVILLSKLLAYITLDIFLVCISICILVFCARLVIRLFDNIYNCILSTKVTIKSNVDSHFHNNFDRKFMDKTIYLKYEITAKLEGLLSRLLITKIPFNFEIPNQPDMKITLLECSGVDISNLNEGWIVSDKTKCIVCALGNKNQKAEILLKCDRLLSSNNTLFYFKINFKDTYLHRLYSRTLAMQFET